MAKLNAKKRNSLPSTDFAVPGRRYPVNDASHARNALARVAQHGSPKEKAEVRAKVHSKFPGIGGGGKMKDEKKSTAKAHERKGEKKMMAHKTMARSRESRGMKKVMGESGKHNATGGHEGYCMDCK
jgi:hypothetical protein